MTLALPGPTNQYNPYLPWVLRLLYFCSYFVSVRSILLDGCLCRVSIFVAVNKVKIVLNSIQRGNITLICLPSTESSDNSFYINILNTYFPIEPNTKILCSIKWKEKKRNPSIVLPNSSRLFNIFKEITSIHQKVKKKLICLKIKTSSFSIQVHHLYI
jgi:hypothetical protein